MSYGIPAPPGYQWVQSSMGSTPSNGVISGYDNGEPMYVGRAYHSGAVLPGKVHPSHRCCYVPWGGREHSCRQYEVLCSTFGGQPNWQMCYGGGVPPGAIQGGRTEDGEALYIGRHMHGGSMVPGKVQKSHSCLYIPYGGEEHSYREFEVLVAGSPYGIPPNQPVNPAYPAFPPSYPTGPSCPQPNYPPYPGYPGNPPGGRW